MDFQGTSGLTPHRRRNGTSTNGTRRSPDWRVRASIPWTLLTSSPVAGPIVFSTPVDARDALRRVTCSAPAESSGSITHYRGTLELLDAAGPNRVVNQLDVELYVRGVVPPRGVGQLGLGRQRRWHERIARPGRRGAVVRPQGIALLVRQDVRHVLVPGVRRGRDRGRCRRRPASSRGEQVLSNQAVADTASVVRLQRRRARLDRVLGVERPTHSWGLVPGRRRPVGRRARQSAPHVDPHHRRRRDRHQVRAARRQRDRHRPRQRIDLRRHLGQQGRPQRRAARHRVGLPQRVQSAVARIRAVPDHPQRGRPRTGCRSSATRSA